VPSFTFYAFAEAIVNGGARPVFCDVDPNTRTVTADSVRAALTPRTTAIVAVDLFGAPAPIGELRQLGLPVLEDAAQAAGASRDGRRAGSLSELATLSFYPSKNLGALGDGGAIATNDDQIAELARALRFHGSYDKQNFDYVGYNSRLDELQAAILRVLLPLDVATHDRADELISGLLERGIEARAYHRRPLHKAEGDGAVRGRARGPVARHRRTRTDKPGAPDEPHIGRAVRWGGRVGVGPTDTLTPGPERSAALPRSLQPSDHPSRSAFERPHRIGAGRSAR
jgi:dTDP-4-amino-4,6-dideoxygalactose transaminase